MTYYLYIIFLCSAALFAQEVTLDTGEYRDIYRAAELAGQARCCSLDWQEFEQAWLADLGTRARLANWPLEKRSYCETLYNDIRQRTEQSDCPPCGPSRRNALQAKLDSTRAALLNDLSSARWSLKPRGQNWISVPPLSRTAPHLKWVAGPKEQARSYINNWLPPDNIDSMGAEFLNLRFLVYAEEALEVLALQARDTHEALRRSVELLQSGAPAAAEETLIQVEEDSFLNNQCDYWLLRGYIRYHMGDRTGARLLVGKILEMPHRDSRQVILAHRVLRELGEFQSDNLRRQVLGFVMEIGRDERVEVLSVYSDGTINLFYSSGGGVLIERFRNPGKVYDVQVVSRSLFEQARQLAFLNRNLLTSGQERQLPRQGHIRLAIITAYETLTAEESIADLNNSFPSIWPYVVYYQRMLSRVYERAEIDR